MTTTPDDTSRPAAAYGILERTVAADDIARHAERIRLLGYTVVPGGFPGDEVRQLGDRLERVLQRQIEEVGAAQLSAIGDSLTARCPLAYDDAFLRLVTHPAILAICRNLLGEYVTLMQQNGVINPPHRGHSQLAYHRDLPYQHFVSSRPLAVSALFCIDPFRPENGATTVIPASHRMEAFPSPVVADELDTAVAAEAGSFIVFDAMLFHRAGRNQTEHPRRAVNQVFSVPIIAQQISLAEALGGRWADDPELAKLLGYDASPARSVRAWRERRLRRQR
jgi:hypothetical protein